MRIAVPLMLALFAVPLAAQDLPPGWKPLGKPGPGRRLAADERGVQVVLHAGWTYGGRNAQGHHEFVAPLDGARMIWVPAGEFLRGSPPPVRKRQAGGVFKIERAGEGNRDEWPQARVRLAGYYIDKHEVSLARYERFVVATGARRPPRPAWAGADHPVTGVSWDEAAAYCRWAGRRLPSEAEWEKAARGTDGRRYPWGAAEPGGPRLANGRFETDPGEQPPAGGSLQERALALFPRVRRPADGYQHTAPVTAFPAGASPYGCLNMAGNVWEWCADAYQVEYYQTKQSRVDPRGPRVDDPGPGKAGRPDRIDRGGAFDVEAAHLRTTYRGRRHPRACAESLGFRTAR